MKECPNCKTMLEDDELFCHECGTKQEIEEPTIQNEEVAAPLGKKCIHCGETIEEDSAFCPFCGKPQTVKEVKEVEVEPEKDIVQEEKPEPKQELELKPEVELKLEEKTKPKEAIKPEENTKPVEKPEQEKQSEPEEKKPITDEDEKTIPQKIPAQETQNEQTTYEQEEEPKSRKWLWILLAVLIAGGIGGWYFLNDDGESYETVETTEDFTNTNLDDSMEEGVTGPHSFLEQFYKKYGDEDYLLDHITANVKNKLRRDYEYNCETNDCLAAWVFTAYPAGADMEMEEGPIISETDVEGKYKVDFKYSCYDGERKQYQMRTVYLTVSKVDGNYLISDYEQYNIIGVDDNMEDAEEQDPLLTDGIVKMAGSVSSYKIHMVLEVNDYHITGYYYYDSQSSDNRVRLIGDIHEDNRLTLKKYNAQGEETGYFEGTFDGSSYIGSNINYNREGSLPFSVERID